MNDKNALQVENIADNNFDQGPPFVFGFGFNKGAGVEMHWEQLADEAGKYEFTWLHLNMNNVETRSWILAQNDIPYAAQNALLAGETRPRVSTFDEGLVVNLRGVNLNEGAEPEDMVSIRVWVDKRRIITTRRRRLKAAQDLRQTIVEGAKLDSPGAIVAKLAARLTDLMEPYVMEIADEVDGLENAMLEGGSNGLRPQLADTRHNAVMLRRYIAPQRDAVARLVTEDTQLFNKRAKTELRETADKVTRLTEEIDAARERAMVLQDQLADQRAEEMNRNMMILSVVAAIFLPLGFLTGLFGINVGGMPGVESEYAFWVIVGLCIVIGLVLLFVFKKLKWL